MILPRFRVRLNSELCRFVVSVTVMLGVYFFWLGAPPSNREGVDFQRYFYFAEHGLPSFLIGSDGYRIVDMLVPFSTPIGYIFLVLFAVSFLVICLFLHQTYFLSFFSFLPLFYFFNFSKDTFVLICLFVLVGAVRLRYFVMALFVPMAFAVAFYLREATLFYVFCASLSILLPKYHFITATIVASITIVFLGLTVAGEGAPEINGSSVLDLARLFSSGSDYRAFLSRALLYVFSLPLQPLLSLRAFYASLDPVRFLEFLAFSSILLVFFSCNVSRRDFVIYMVGFAFLVSAVFSFYHFRYYALLLPVAAVLSDKRLSKTS